jgi:hypothetical protein
LEGEATGLAVGLEASGFERSWAGGEAVQVDVLHND